jgi:uncharacterized membrane protein YqjE
MDPEESEGQGIFASLRRLAGSSVGLLHNRLELLSVELQEEKRWLITTLIWGFAVVFFGALAITVITGTIVILSPESARPYVLIGFSALYLAVAVAMALGLKRQLKNRPPPFSDSIGELKKDLGRLQSRDES